MSKWYGSLENRLEENQPYNDEIKVGTLLTRFDYSDRHPFEVIQVNSQKDIIVRELNHKKADDTPMSNNWEVFSDVSMPTCNYVYRYGHWYEKYISRTTKKPYYSKVNISFGYADYYYDYSF